MKKRIVKTTDTVYKGDSLHHGCWDLVLNLEGTGTMTADKQTFAFEEGTLFCFPPYVTHEKSSSTGYRDIHIYTYTFLPGFADKGVLSLQDDELHTARTLFFQMLDMQNNQTVARMQLIEELYHVLLTWILLQYNASEAPLAVQEITRKLEQNFTNPTYSVVPLLQGYNYCPDYIRRLFKKHHGCSPSEYLTRLRLEHAKGLLRTHRLNGYTIPQIAWESGFNDPNYFSRLFKKYTLLTPLQYVKQIADI